MKIIKYGAVIIGVIGTQLLTACGGYIVATGPPPMVDEVIVAAPSPRHVWVPGYYSYDRGNYVFVNGSYRIPPRGRTSYVQSNWQHTSKGYKRNKGHWN